ncbi:MAG: DUF1624 domain-containing protein [Clostridia bacterium]|nr:DUF1624 domain-containing protein [Clostridia bacterium]
MSETTVSPLQRVPSVDRFRGFVIFCMIIFQFAEKFPALGVVSRLAVHAPKENGIYILPNLTLADLIAPAFILAIGLTYVPSLQRRIEKNGKKEAVLHFVKRYLMLIGIGITMDGVNDIIDGKFDEPLPLMFIVLSVLVLLGGLAAFILKLAKVKKRAKYYTVLSWYVAFVGVVGLVVAAVNAVMLVTGKTDRSFGHWVVLHHIGFAGLIALPFALMKGERGHWLRLVCGSVMFLLYTLFHEGNLAGDLFNSNRELIDEVADGGFIGGFAFGSMLILYMFFAGEFRRRKHKFLPPVALCVFAAVVAGVLVGVFKTLPADTPWPGAISGFLPINKGSESPSYVLIAGFISLFAFYIFELFNGLKLSFDPFAWWGKNPILLYCIEFAVIGGLNAALEDTFKSMSAPVAAAVVIVVTVALTALAYLLHKKKIIVKL